MRKKITLFFSILFIINVFCLPVYALSEEEAKILQMYFSEDELVVSSTRAPKPLSQVTENISIVTAEDIENMNAHTVNEVLEMVTGIFVDFQGHDFGSTAPVEIQGSAPRHVLLLLDGVPWNFLSDSSFQAHSIPVTIIKRIEIIKGPASSTWGSAMGGVINIVTKDAGSTDSPSGTVRASYGERNTQDYRAEISGKAGKVGYYLYAGRQDADGLKDDRYFENDTIYSKFSVPVYPDAKIVISAGYSEPYFNYGDLPDYNLASTGLTRAFFTTASFIAEITNELDFEASVYTYENKYVQDVRKIDTGSLFKKSTYDEKTIGGSGKLVWKRDRHTAVIGVDVSDGDLEQVVNYYKAPEITTTDPGISKWAVFANDTISAGRFSITPGIRYDHNNITGSFTSPSLGATYKFDDHTILRASVARGFTSPPLLYLSGGGFKLDPNPDLEPENVWSYQAGIESWAAEFLRAKLTVFHHDQDDSMVKETVAGHTYKMYLNKEGIKRNGIELELETVPVYNTSLKTGLAYVYKKNIEEDSGVDEHSANAVVRYDDRKTLLAQLSGSYRCWDHVEHSTSESGMLWDVNIRKKVHSTERTRSEVFLTIHNIFNGARYIYDGRVNPDRWAEAGLRVKF